MGGCVTKDEIDVLLAEHDREVQLNLLDAMQVTADTLFALAKARMQTSPDIARQLLELCDLPDATYQLAQLHAQAGAYRRALPLVAQAREQFLAANRQIAAQRTTVGEMMILMALGRPTDALSAAEHALAALGERAPHITGKLYQNQGLIYDQQGEFAKAIASYDAANAAYLQTNNVLAQSDILKNRGVTLLSLGEARAALTAFEQAVNLVDEQTQPLRQGRTFANIGYAQMLLGNYGESLDALQSARTLLNRAGALQYGWMAELDSADLYQTVGRNADAITAYASANAGLSTNGMAYHAARALLGWGVALCATGQFVTAAEKLAAAKTAFAALDNRTLVARVGIEQASLQRKQGDKTDALATLTPILDRADLSDQATFAAQLTLADATDDLVIRQAALTTASEIADRLPLPHLRYRVLQRQGALAVRVGDGKSAETNFRTAIDIVESLRGTLPQEALRISFLDDRLNAHRGLLRLLLDQERLEEAWQLGEQIKSRTLTEAQQRERTASQLEIDDLRQQLDALYNLLLDEGGETRRIQQQADLKNRVLQLEKAILQAQSTFIPPHPRATRFVTDNDLATANITYHLLGEELLAIVQRGSQLQVVRSVAKWSDVVEMIALWEVQLRWMSGASAFVQQRAALLARSAQQALHTLYERLFAPFEPLLTGCETLLIVPTDRLHQLPFHALYDGATYLLERFTVRYAPSVTVDQLAKKEAAPDYRHVAAFGVDDPALAYVSAELTALAPHFTTADCFYNITATRQTVTETTAPVLHFATHGIFRSEHPLFSGLRLHDGWLTAHDVTRLDLHNRLVVLSACESGRAQLAAGDEVLGLPHAFLGAGARSVVASLWLVQDEVSAELMPTFYKHLQQTQDPASALRFAQLDMLAIRQHPYFWANFVLFGGDVR